VPNAVNDEICPEFIEPIKRLENCVLEDAMFANTAKQSCMDSRGYYKIYYLIPSIPYSFFFFFFVVIL
jgi:hypothetical protein